MMISLLIHTISGDIQFFTLRKLVATLMNLLRLCKMTADIHGNLLFDNFFWNLMKFQVGNKKKQDWKCYFHSYAAGLVY